MRLSNIHVAIGTSGAKITAIVTWEVAERAPFTLTFETFNAPPPSLDQAGNALMTAMFPVAFHDREARIVMDAPLCPMLADNLQTVLSWWNNWSGGPPQRMLLEGDPASPADHLPTPATAFLSGGVDSFHMLHRNRRLYAAGSPASIGRLILVHGFDIGRRKRNAEDALFADAVARFENIVGPLGISVATCRTNLRQIPLSDGFWTERFYGAAAIAAGHAITPGTGYLMIAGTYDIPNLGPLGSNPAIDIQFSSQRMQVLHEGLRFSRLEKVRELLEWPPAINNLRVCAQGGRETYNCGQCEKCLRTRLELLAVGCMHSDAFGATAFAPGLFDDPRIEIDNGYQAACYRDVIAALREGPHAALAAAAEAKLAAYAASDIRRAKT
jgi:hypothetical protein